MGESWREIAKYDEGFEKSDNCQWHKILYVLLWKQPDFFLECFVCEFLKNLLKEVNWHKEKKNTIALTTAGCSHKKVFEGAFYFTEFEVKIKERRLVYKVGDGNARSIRAKIQTNIHITTSIPTV